MIGCVVVSINEVLAKRGITPEMLEVRKPMELDWQELKESAKTLAKDMLVMKKYRRIGILYDVDVDGLYSGYVLEDFLLRTSLNEGDIHRFMNPQKAHGITKHAIAWIEEKELDFLFIVDAGSSDVALLTEKFPDLTVYILDHHPYEQTNMAEYPNITLLNVSDHEHLPDLSGCGVVFRFVELLGRMLRIETEIYEPYVGITVLSDVCSMLVPENRYYVQKAYDNYHGNLFLKSFTFWGSYKTFYSFQVIPYLNALIRCGETERAMTIVHNMDNPKLCEDIQEDVVRVKAKQASLVDNMRRIGQIKQADNCVVHIRHDGEELRPFNGLLGNKLMSEYNQSAMVLRLNREKRTWEGSFRGKNFGNQLLKDFGFWVAGHDKACGVKVEHELLLKFLDKFKSVAEPDKEADLKLAVSDLTYTDLVYLATFNDYASGDLEPITIELQNDWQQFTKVPGNSAKRTLYNIEDKQVVDFIGSNLPVKVIVEPSLSRNGYQLIRTR